MSGEMVERVARALREELRRIGYGVGTINAGQLSDTLARAAIEAMREPTDSMLAEGDSMMPQIAKGQDISTGLDALAEAWPVMIDAALSRSP